MRLNLLKRICRYNGGQWVVICLIHESRLVGYDVRLKSEWRDPRGFESHLSYPGLLAQLETAQAETIWLISPPGLLAQLEEHPTSNREVVGSSPT
jgi:hypothetical protein